MDISQIIKTFTVMNKKNIFLKNIYIRKKKKKLACTNWCKRRDVHIVVHFHPLKWNKYVEMVIVFKWNINGNTRSMIFWWQSYIYSTNSNILLLFFFIIVDYFNWNFHSNLFLFQSIIFKLFQNFLMSSFLFLPFLVLFRGIF